VFKIPFKHIHKRQSSIIIETNMVSTGIGLSFLRYYKVTHLKKYTITICNATVKAVADIRGGGSAGPPSDGREIFFYRYFRSVACNLIDD
jgi:hypothetical protein